jgi:hypothetical protein
MDQTESSDKDHLRFIPKRTLPVSVLQVMNAQRLRQLDEPMLILYRQEPLAVLVPVAIYMEMQRLIFEYALP